jgi:DNA polymerase sigma
MPYLGGVSARPALNLANNAWQELRLSLPWAQAILCQSNKTLCVQRASNATISKHGCELPVGNEPNVYPESLRETLDAHREANRASLIHKVSEGGKRERLDLGPPVTKTPQITPKKKLQTALHLRFARAKRQQGRRGRGDIKNTEYIGQSRGLTAQWRNSPSAPLNKHLPWLRELSAASELSSTNQCSASERLTSEILAFYNYILPKPDELAAADQAITAFRSCIASIDPCAHIDLIGSRRTGLATALSDLDFNITHANGGNSTGLSRDREQAHELLQSLWSKLPKRHNSIQASAFIDGARVPIITGLHVPTNLKFQIQCTGDVFNSTTYAQECISEYPTLRPLYMILRQMFEIRGLNIGRLGGIGSYPLLIMIVAALKFSEAKIGRREAGKQLCFFLDMYCKIDFYTTAVSLAPLEYVLKGLANGKRPSRKTAHHSPDRGPHQNAIGELSEDELEGRKWFSHSRPEPHLMCLQDPSNPGHDLGRQVKLIKHVQAVLIEADLKLRECMDVWDSTDWTQSSTAKNNLALLDWFVGADYEIYEDERKLLNVVGQAYRQVKSSHAVGENSSVFASL